MSIFPLWRILNDPSAQPTAVQEIMAKNPLPIPYQLVLGGIGLLVSLVSGIFLLRGSNWARWLYVVWSGVAFLISLFTSPRQVDAVA